MQASSRVGDADDSLSAVLRLKYKKRGYFDIVMEVIQEHVVYVNLLPECILAVMYPFRLQLTIYEILNNRIRWLYA